ncbi:SCO family protein [Oceanimonas sp. CHS3-5]|uniref:SCO family protein n=1 Tax=Oceanimonas sp. CHS3-5 TaxID=3068186 RepID=UPI00273E51A7|nr:SCO family protein [Oceanimonas sp. CHS3-5]MDP5292805.1 SCO family protein [Oceanimonas sp. CHS3-5]
MANTSKLIWLLALTLLVAGTLSGIAWYNNRANTLTKAVVVYPEPRPLKAMALTDAEGQPFTEQRFQDHWSLVFVGYTYCPDICPTTLSDLARIYPELTRLSDKTQVVFVSADPGRDTPERLKAYTAHFNPDFIAATAEHAQLMPAVQQLGLIYGVHERGEQDYLVDHSASIALINPDAQLHASFRPVFDEGSGIPLVDGQLLLQDLERIIARWRG